ncbi:hypothetical protein BBJ28_00020716 [Nothophytophthora sp. Chile5]|nr:hypothetical protein BBJ28_00020716 [Nothophytophthora sp. Chile5]
MGRHIWINVFGELALLCFVLIGVTSIPWIRRKMFDLFYYVHQLLFLAVGFTVLHWASALWFLLPPFAAYIISRTLSRCNAATPAIVAQFSALSPSLCKLVLVRSPQQQGDFQVGQFVYLKVPAISKLQWHAFTIASSPRSSLGSREFPETMTLLVKALGDWTEELVAYAQDCERRQLEPKVHVDGYYGASLGELYPLYETVVLVGGGIGMTPLLAVLDDVCTAAETRQTRGQRALRQRIFVIFMMRELELLAEIYPLLARVRELDPFGRFFSVSISLTSTPTGKLLDRPLYQGAQSPKKRDFHPASKRSKPFAVSLGHDGRSLVHFVAFAVVVTLVLVLQYGNGRLVGDLHDSVWAVRSAIKVLALLSASVCVYIGVALTRWTPEARVACNLLKTQYGTDDLHLSEKLLLSDPKRYAAADLLSYRGLVSELRVRVGQQPNLAVQLREVHSMHLRRCASKNSPISVFVSGPTSLKTATVAAVAAIDARDFDIHEEEFEL